MFYKVLFHPVFHLFPIQIAKHVNLKLKSTKGYFHRCLGNKALEIFMWEVFHALKNINDILKVRMYYNCKVILVKINWKL